MELRPIEVTEYSLLVCNMYMNQQDAQKIRMIRLYFPLHALHVSDYISPSSGATFISCTSYLVHAGTIRLAVLWL